MANDRIVLMCRCGQGVSIYKFYPGGGYATADKRLGWIGAHVRSCHKNVYGPDLDGDVPFTLTTENSIDEGTWFDGVLTLGARK